MVSSSQSLKPVVRAAAETIVAHADELTDLDQAIGDGDHGINMKRGAEAVLATIDEIAAKPTPEALKAIGMALVMKVGGASGPLYGSLLLGMGKAWNDGGRMDRATISASFAAGIDAVKARGKSDRGQKTMLDVLIPVLDALREGEDEDLAGLTAKLRKVADDAAEATRDMKAERGRASFLGERSIGHVDPGARSSSLMIGAICSALGEAS